MPINKSNLFDIAISIRNYAIVKWLEEEQMIPGKYLEVLQSNCPEITEILSKQNKVIMELEQNKQLKIQKAEEEYQLALQDFKSYLFSLQMHLKAGAEFIQKIDLNLENQIFKRKLYLLVNAEKKVEHLREIPIPLTNKMLANKIFRDMYIKELEKKGVSKSFIDETLKQLIEDIQTGKDKNIFPKKLSVSFVQHEVAKNFALSNNNLQGCSSQVILNNSNDNDNDNDNNDNDYNINSNANLLCHSKKLHAIMQDKIMQRINQIALLRFLDATQHINVNRVSILEEDSKKNGDYLDDLQVVVNSLLLDGLDDCQTRIRDNKILYRYEGGLRKMLKQSGSQDTNITTRYEAAINEKTLFFHKLFHPAQPVLCKNTIQVNI